MIANLAEIKQLLNLFYSGLASPEEESRLVELLRSTTSLPQELMADCDIIIALSQCGHIDVPTALKTNLMRSVDKLDRQHRLTHMGRRIITLSSIAACLVVAISMIVFIARNSSSNPHEITDPQTACSEATRALLMVSEGLNNSDIIESGSQTATTSIFLFDDSLLEDDLDIDSIPEAQL